MACWSHAALFRSGSEQWNNDLALWSCHRLSMMISICCNPGSIDCSCNHWARCCMCSFQCSCLAWCVHLKICCMSSTATLQNGHLSEVTCCRQWSICRVGNWLQMTLDIRRSRLWFDPLALRMVTKLIKSYVPGPMTFLSSRYAWTGHLVISRYWVCFTFPVIQTFPQYTDGIPIVDWNVSAFRKTFIIFVSKTSMFSLSKAFLTIGILFWFTFDVP